jgi:hypothetical protein
MEMLIDMVSQPCTALHTTSLMQTGSCILEMVTLKKRKTSISLVQRVPQFWCTSPKLGGQPAGKKIVAQQFVPAICFLFSEI